MVIRKIIKNKNDPMKIILYIFSLYISFLFIFFLVLLNNYYMDM